jgi:hypothetical protein
VNDAERHQKIVAEIRRQFPELTEPVLLDFELDLMAAAAGLEHWS